MCELISVVVPVYNVSEYLESCLNGLSKQTDSNYEVILVDDGSTDQSCMICDDYCRIYKHFSLIKKTNGGVSSARNLGIKHARGQLLCFVDSDDFVKPDYLLDLRREMTQDVDFVLSKFYFVDDGKVLEPKSIHKVGCPDILFEKDTILACQAPYGKLFKKDIISRNSICFDEKVMYGEDRLFVYSYLLYVNKVSISPKMNYYYIRRQGSLTSKLYSIETEKYAYGECKRIINSLVEELNLNDKNKLINLYAEVCDFGNRILNVIYHTADLSRKERLVLFNEIDLDFHSKFLRADSLKEKFLRLLLRSRMYGLYDLIRFMKQVY